MNTQQIIATKRDGLKHSRDEIEFLVQAASTGQAADYQLSAWLMAAYLHPLDSEETAWLTLAMAQSGERIDLSGLPKPWLDKHSTGGVGDKTTLILLPLLAACGITAIKMSGRGLGITGGTVDKLESVPGFRIDLSPTELVQQAKRVGIALTGQTPSLAPADKAFYALRDATATIASVPLIVASILSKKIAGGAETVVLDVKCGSGGFMKSFAEASVLADALNQTAELCGLNVRTTITDMDQPLGRMVGNALEVVEAAEVLSGKSTGRLVSLCTELVGIALDACGVAPSVAEGVKRAQDALDSGKAMECAQAWFAAQGADPRVLGCPESFLPTAPTRLAVHYDGEPGWAERVDAGIVGNVVLALGGGRRRKEDDIDPVVGVEVGVEVGDSVQPGQIVFTAFARTSDAAEAACRTLMEALSVSREHVPPSQLVLKRS